MRRVNVQEAKTHLSRLLEEVEAGQTVVVCRRNVPIAEIRRLPQPRRDLRPIGLAAGAFEVPASFFDPLPDDVLALFEGERDA